MSGEHSADKGCAMTLDAARPNEFPRPADNLNPRNFKG